MKSSLFTFSQRVTAKDRAFLVREIAIMLSSGVPLAKALTLVSQQTAKPLLRDALKAITRDVEAGHAFSAAAANQSHIFNSMMIAMLKSGEASGQLNTILTELADQLEGDVAFGGKVTNALLYPGFVVFVMVIVGIIMTIFIIPKLTEVFASSELTLPWSTQLLMAISNLMLHYWYVLLLMAAVAFIVGRSYLATEAGKLSLYRLQLAFPATRNLINNSYLARFSRILGMLIRAGVPITEALKIVTDSLPNAIWKRSLVLARQEVERGIPLSVALSRHTMFPSPLTQMISVGEETGKLESVLDYLAKSYEEQTDSAVKAITSLIGPVILVVVAVAVGFVVLSVILPIYGLADQL